MNYLENLYNIKNKVAIITGGGGVLAGKMAEGLVKSGAKVILLDLKMESTRSLVAELSNFGEIKGMTCNVLDKSILESVKDRILSDFGRIDIFLIY